MGYRIEYGPKQKRRSWVLPLAAGMVLGCLLLALLWPGGAQALRAALLPGDPAVTTAALERFADDVHSGEPVIQALEQLLQELFGESNAP